MHNGLIDEIREIKKKLEITRNHFDNASDDEEISSLIYEEKAYMLKLSYLIRAAKQEQSKEGEGDENA